MLFYWKLYIFQDALKELKSGAPSNFDVTSLIDHTEIQAKLSKALEERNAYKIQYEVTWLESQLFFKNSILITKKHEYKINFFYQNIWFLFWIEAVLEIVQYLVLIGIILIVKKLMIWKLGLTA